MFRSSSPLTRGDALAPCHSRGAAPSAGRGSSPQSSSQPTRRGDLPRLGIRCSNAPMRPAALRVLETTWRTWREPLG
jgi:hypothetical protein